MDSDTALKHVEPGDVPLPQQVPHPPQPAVDNGAVPPSVPQLQHFQQASAPPQSMLPSHAQGMHANTQAVPPSSYTQQVIPQLHTQQGVSPLNTQQQMPQLHTQQHMPQLYTQQQMAPSNTQQQIPPLNTQQHMPQLHTQQHMPPLNTQAMPSLNIQQQMPPVHTQQEMPSSHTQQQMPPLNTQQAMPPFNTQQQMPQVHTQQEMPPSHTQQQMPPVHTQQEMPQLHTQQQMPPINTQQEMSALNRQQEMPPSNTQQMPPVHTQAVPQLNTQQEMPALNTQQEMPPSHTQQAMPSSHTQQQMPCQQPLLAQTTGVTTTPPGRYEAGLAKCLRGILYFYNICLFILGAAAISLGIWLLLGDVKVQYLAVFVGQYHYLPLATYLLTAGGSMSVFVAVLGIFAIYQENKYAFGIYGVMMFLALLAFGISSHMCIFSKDIMSGGIKDNMRESLISSYGVDIRTNAKNRQITESWDYIQRQFECCGVSGDINSTDSWAVYITMTLWYNQILQSGAKYQKVPYSCCKGGDEAICTGQVYWPGPPNHLNPRKDKHKKLNPYLHTTGCFDKLEHFLKTYYSVVPNLSGFASTLYSLFGITSFIVAVCLMIFTKQKLETRLR